VWEENTFLTDVDVRGRWLHTPTSHFVGAAFDISTSSSGDRNPAIAAVCQSYPSQLIVTWEHWLPGISIASGGEIHARQLFGVGSIGSEQNLLGNSSIYSSISSANPAVVYNLDSDAYMVAWDRDYSSADRDIDCQYIMSSGTQVSCSCGWAASAGIERNPAVASYHTPFADDPDRTIHNSSNFLLVWEYEATTGADTDIRAAIY